MDRSSSYGKQAKLQKFKKQPFKTLTIDLPLNRAIYRCYTYPQDYYARARVKSELLAEAGFYMASDLQSLVCQYCDLEITSLEEWKNLNLNGMLLLHRKLSPSCTLASGGCSNNIPLGEISHIRNYKLEAHRLFSLLRSEVQHYWIHVNPFELARWGFYYAGSEDNVRCAFCNLEVRGWEKDDTAEGEHIRWNQHCCFLKQPQSTGNVKIGEECNQAAGASFDSIGINHPSKAPSMQSIYPTLKARKNAVILSESSLGINEMNPARHPKFATMSERLKSFSNWPKSMVQRPRTLAVAGFFYTGIGDRTICFQCGLGLRDWVSGDNEWEQHVKWSPSCPFLLMAKGTSFVNQKLHCPAAAETILKMEVDGVEQKENRSDSLQCQKCVSNNCCVSLPCGHMSVCTDCFEKHENCAECGQFVLAAVNVFMN